MRVKLRERRGWFACDDGSGTANGGDKLRSEAREVVVRVTGGVEGTGRVGRERREEMMEN